MSSSAQHSFVHALLQRAVSLLGAAGLTLAFFLLLPLIQAITKSSEPDTLLQSMDAGSLEPPAPLAEEEPPEPEPEREEPPPELEENLAPPDLAQLELALNAGFGEGWLGGGFQVSIGSLAGVVSDEALDTLFSSAELDQPPRAVFQAQPLMTPELHQLAPATVKVVFSVDSSGRVVDAKVLSTDNPAFDRAALDAVKKWRFEPGKRNGQPVTFRVLQPITFPKN